MVQPKYRAMIRELELRILHGHLSAGDPIPSTSALCLDFGVSATVVLQATMVLLANGIVEGVPGVGRFVTQDAQKILKERGDL